MISKLDLKASDIALMRPLLSKIEKTIAEAIRVPSIIIDDSSPQEREFKNIVDYLKRDFPDIIITLKLTGTLLQILFPEEELLISIIFLLDREHNTRHIKLELAKLSSALL